MKPRSSVISTTTTIIIIIAERMGAPSRELLGEVGKKGQEREGLTLDDIETEETAFVIYSVFVLFLGDSKNYACATCRLVSSLGEKQG